MEHAHLCLAVNQHNTVIAHHALIAVLQEPSNKTDYVKEAVPTILIT